MKRMHVHVSVANLGESIRFYSTLFAQQPAVVKSDYAKWMLDDPHVNFAISQRGAAIGLNHLGVQVESDEDLRVMHKRLGALESKVIAEADAACCYAKSDKYWVTDPSGIAWETFHTLDSIPVFGGGASQDTADKRECCVPLAATTPQAPCCVPVPDAPGSSSGCCT
jgi:hypothetical protein